MPDDEESLEDLLFAYLQPPAEPNASMAGVQVVWVENDPDFGARHIFEKHSVQKHEVEEVLFEVPPYVEAKRAREHPERTFFWGATRGDRWLFVVCEDWTEEGVRYLKPITAFEPDAGVAYWNEKP